MAGPFDGGGTAAALSTMGWPDQGFSARDPGTPFQFAPTAGVGGGQRWPLSGLADTGSGFGGPRFDLGAFGPGELDYNRQLSAQSQANYEATMAAKQAQYSGSTTPGSTGPMASIGGDWAGVDQWNAQIQAAASQYGVPANLIKAIMKLESGGDPGSVSPQKATGLMQIMPDWNGTAGLSIYDNQQNIMLGAYILKQSYDNWASQGAADPWQEAVRDYIGRGGADAFGTDQNSYWTAIKGNWDQLNGASVGAGTGIGGGGTSGATGTGWQNSFSTMFGTNAVPDWGEFNAPSGNGLYEYGRAYGLNGTSHTGLDIPLSLNTPMRAGFSGHVVCSATGSGTNEDSCTAFGDSFGGGAGRIEIMSDDGNTVLIYGHSSQTAVSPGQRVNAGQVVGYSGGQNSLHVHLEARVRDASMPSGWRLVDPRQVLGGGVPTGGGGGTGTPSASPIIGPSSFANFWINQYGR